MIKPRTPITIRIDTREQNPLTFDPQRAVTVRGCIPAFDYALDGDQDYFAVERKSLGDFVNSTLSAEAWERELNKIIRARRAGMSPLVYVCECRFTDLFSARTYRMLDEPQTGPDRMMQRWRHLTMIEKVQVIFACDAERAALAVYGLLKIRAEYLKENC